MSSILKVDQLQDSGGNAIITSDGAGNLTTMKTNYPAFLLDGNGTLQSTSNNTFTKVINFSTTIDTDNSISSATFTVPTGKDGKYLLFGCTSWVTNSGGQRLSQIRKNGSEIIRLTSLPAVATNNNVCAGGSGILDLTAGDDLELFCMQSSGGNLDLQTNSSQRVRFGGYRIGD